MFLEWEFWEVYRQGVVLPAFLELSNKLKEVVTYTPNPECTGSASDYGT
jgi:hypothetical protein